MKTFKQFLNEDVKQLSKTSVEYKGYIITRKAYVDEIPEGKDKVLASDKALKQIDANPFENKGADGESHAYKVEIKDPENNITSHFICQVNNTNGKNTVTIADDGKAKEGQDEARKTLKEFLKG